MCVYELFLKHDLGSISLDKIHLIIVSVLLVWIFDNIILSLERWIGLTPEINRSGQDCRRTHQEEYRESDNPHLAVMWVSVFAICLG